MPCPALIELIYLVCIAHVWARGSIFKPFRKNGPRLWVMLADCPLCAGFWIGVLGHFLVPANVIYVLGVGAIIGTCALGLCALIRRL